MIYCLLLALCSCATLPELYKVVDNVATDDAITVKVDRDAFKRQSDIHVSIDVLNKEKN